MKKAKIILVAFTLFATVGAALAFKAQKFNGDLFCTSVLGAACANSKFIYAPQIGNFSYCSTDSTGCSHIGSQIRVVEDAR